MNETPVANDVAGAGGPGAFRPRRLVLLIILIAVPVPPLVYWLAFGLHAAMPPAAKAILTADAGAVLVDVREPKPYAQQHVQGAVNWPLAQIMSLDSADEVPTGLKGKRLVLICASGRMTAVAARKLRRLGLAGTVHVRGGIQAWIADARNRTGGPLDLFVTDGKAGPPPARDATLLEQLAAVVAGFVVKPTYGVLSFILIIVLWRRRSPDLAALKWAMVCFFIGEQACAVNYLFFAEQSYLTEYVHSLGMAMCFGFATFAVFEGMDLRLIRFSGKGQKCAALSLCTRCYKYADVPCGLKRTFLIVIPAVMTLAFMPLTASIKLPSYNASIFGMFYNYSHPAAYQMFEIRYCPILGLLLLGASLGALLLKKGDPVPLAKVLFAAGMGPLGFGLLRLFISTPYGDNLVWFVFWEEATEMLFIAAVAYILWTFRKGLFGKGSSDRPAAP